MPQFRFVETAQRSPGYCMCCGSHTGPFIDLDIPFVTVNTAIGTMQAEGGTYLCVGTEDNPGCAIQASRLTGMMVETVKLLELKDHVEGLNQEIAELRAALSKKTITVGDLLKNNLVQSIEVEHVL